MYGKTPLQQALQIVCVKGQTMFDLALARDRLKARRKDLSSRDLTPDRVVLLARTETAFTVVCDALRSAPIDASEQIARLKTEKASIRSDNVRVMGLYRESQRRLTRARARAFSAIEHAGQGHPQRVQVAKEFVRGRRTCLR